jgi:hypothetical protein
MERLLAATGGEQREKMTLYCNLCDEPIKFNDEHISERTGKKIPLHMDTDEPHDCPVWRSQQQEKRKSRKYYSCRKGCGREIYFDANHNKSQSGKWIPLSKDTGQPHQCQ